ncbi:NACHT domain- and WD repeat-containing protein 1 isoform X2 [Lingula anatina]|nr:NACHT domain- and WD repeat-containing protein 1 isoform X2 [Lingula anatina]XP_013386914.1 NACHT domain- and WD repeat-containing protein 1 isoform X2 [Lingula anatina]|eukprot:XP_013386906.1 NACHT domain- and WD repeat-containing protein 1 isoform X2 [Lingula anatina]
MQHPAEDNQSKMEPHMPVMSESVKDASAAGILKAIRGSSDNHDQMTRIEKVNGKNGKVRLKHLPIHERHRVLSAFKRMISEDVERRITGAAAREEELRKKSQKKQEKMEEERERFETQQKVLRKFKPILDQYDEFGMKIQPSVHKQSHRRARSETNSPSDSLLPKDNYYLSPLTRLQPNDRRKSISHESLHVDIIYRLQGDKISASLPSLGNSFESQSISSLDSIQSLPSGSVSGDKNGNVIFNKEKAPLPDIVPKRDSGIELHAENDYSADGRDPTGQLKQLSASKKRKAFVTQQMMSGATSCSFQSFNSSNETTVTDFQPKDTNVNSRLKFPAEMSRTEIREEMLKGRLHTPYCTEENILRIYISSTSTDTIGEGKLLTNSVYPYLQNLAQKKGYELQLLDLHWGINGLFLDDHSYAETCRRALECCLEKHGLNFISFLSEKYGHPNLPTVFSKEEFEAILSAVEKERDAEIANFVTEQTRHLSIANPKEMIMQLTNQKNRESSQDIVVKMKKSASNPSVPSYAPSPRRSLQNPFSSGMGGLAAIAKVAIRTQENEGIQENPFQGLEDLELLQECYALDTNTSPHVYRLQNISAHFPDFTEKDASRVKLALDQWQHAARRLLGVLQKYSKMAKVDQRTIRKLCISLQEEENSRGFFENENHQNCAWFYRCFSDIQLQDSKAGDYVDLIQPGTKDPDKDVALQELVDKMCMVELPKNHYHRFLIPWAFDGFNPEGNRPKNREHNIYAKKMCRSFQDVVEHYIESLPYATASSINSLSGVYEKHVTDIVQHANFCIERAKRFYGRSDQLHSTRNLLWSTRSSPIVVHGKPGMGTSSLLSTIACSATEWMKREDLRVLFRSIGHTSMSTSFHTLLQGLCFQLRQIFNLNTSDLKSMNLKWLMNEFDDLLSHANTDKPLLIILDGLDRLILEQDSANDLQSWIPSKLPDNVHIVLSMNTGSEIMNLLQQKIPAEKFLEILPLSEEVASNMFYHFLHGEGRCVTDAQLDVVLEAFQPETTPLLVYMVFREACKWTSFTHNKMKLGKTVRTMAFNFAGHLAKVHGELLVRRTFGFLCTAKNGLTQSELHELLTQDSRVMEFVSTLNKSSFPRLPSFILVRLLNNLTDAGYVTKILGDGGQVLYKWAHWSFQEAYTEMYLKGKELVTYHKAMAAYFLGRPLEESSDTEKYRKQSGCNEHVEEGTYGLEIKRSYNLRLLNELPHHLIMAQETLLLKTECLLNYEWLLAKLCSTSLWELLDDYHQAESSNSDEGSDMELYLVIESLKRGCHVLTKDPHQLASQLIGRLFDIMAKDVPATSEDPRKYPHFPALLDAAAKSSIPVIVPSATCLLPPGSLTGLELGGHHGAITAVTVTNSGKQAVSASLDNTLKLWDLQTGRVTKTIKGVGKEAYHIKMAMQDRYAIVCETYSVQIWSLEKGHLVRVIEQLEDYVIPTTASNGTMLLLFVDGGETMHVWNLDGEVTHVNSFHLEEKDEKKEEEEKARKQKMEQEQKNKVQIWQMLEEEEEDEEDLVEGSQDDKSPPVEEIPDEEEVTLSAHRGRSTTVSSCTYGDQILHGFRGDTKAYAHNVHTGQLAYTININDIAARLRAVGTTPMYFVLACHCDDHFIFEIFDNSTGLYIRTIKGCAMDASIQDVEFNKSGSHAIGLVSSQKTGATYLAVWNLETEEHRHLGYHSGITNLAACLNLSYCVTASSASNNLMVWDITLGLSKKVPVQGVVGIEEITILDDNPRYVVAKPMDCNGPVTVWNLFKTQCKISAVCSERGLVEDMDLLLVKNMNVVILTDCMINKYEEYFTSILVFNLETRQYDRILHGAHIDVGLSNEYFMLNGERVMSPSPDRTHFVIWSLESGQTVLNIYKDRSKLSDVIKSSVTSHRKRGTTAKMLPWQRRSETKTGRQRRHQREIQDENDRIEGLKKGKENLITQFLVSDDEKMIVASYFSCYLCVFDITRGRHIQTLVDDKAILTLDTSALTSTGGHLVHTYYDDVGKFSCVVVWDCMTGKVHAKLEEEEGVCAVAINDSATQVVFGNICNEMVWWDLENQVMHKLPTYTGFQLDIYSTIYILHNSSKAMVLAKDISLWDFKKGILSVFTPDVKIQCSKVVLNRTAIAFGLPNSPTVVTLKYSADNTQGSSLAEATNGQELFGETHSDSEDSD